MKDTEGKRETEIEKEEERHICQKFFYNLVFKNCCIWPGVLVYTFNSITKKVEAGGFVWFTCQPSLQSEFQDIQGT